MDARLDWHNHGPSGHTLSDRPWSLVVAIEFRRQRDAVRFEKYLKSGSGRAFAKRHFAGVDSEHGSGGPPGPPSAASPVEVIGDALNVAGLNQEH